MTWITDKFHRSRPPKRAVNRPAWKERTEEALKDVELLTLLLKDIVPAKLAASLFNSPDGKLNRTQANLFLGAIHLVRDRKEAGVPSSQGASLLEIMTVTELREIVQNIKNPGADKGTLAPPLFVTGGTPDGKNEER